MIKAKTPEEFASMQERIKEQHQVLYDRRYKSTMLPADHPDRGKRMSFSEVYTATGIENKARSDAREVEIAASPYAMDRHIPWRMLPPNDRLRIEEKRRHWEDERLRLEALQAKVLEKQNGTSV